MANIDFVFFDLGNVILPFDYDRMCRQVASAAQIDTSLSRQVLLEGDLQADYESGRVTSREFFESFCQRTNSTPDQGELMLALSDIFALNARIIPIMAQFHATNFPIGLLSNTCEAHWSFIGERFPIVRWYFDQSKVLSFQVKCAKPDPEIYAAAIELAGCPAEKIFFVDDKLENVDGAKAAGLIAEQFESADGLIRSVHQLGLKINL